MTNAHYRDHDPASENARGGRFLTATLLDESELVNARNLLRQLSPSPIMNAVRFRNTLQGFIENLSRNQGAQPFSEILCVDTTEVFSWASPDSGTVSGFGFGTLMEAGVAGLNTTDTLSDHYTYRDLLEDLDQMILQHLLFERKEGFGLLDPHAEEISIIFAATQKAQERLKAASIPSVPADVFSLTNEQLDNIRKWVLSQEDERSRLDEFTKFRTTFLPAWRDGLIQELGKLHRVDARFEKFFRDGKYSFLAPGSQGDRSLIDRIAKHTGLGIDRQKLMIHLESEESRESFNEARRIVIDLASAIPGVSYKSLEVRSESIRRDAEAVALIHVLNTYLRRNEMPARIELVTRSATLHGVAAVLPPSRIWFGLRHPLFMPNIYAFPSDALEQMASLFQSVDHALRPWLDALEQRTSFERPDEATQTKVVSEVGALSRKLIEVLADFITIQDTLDKGDEAAGKLVENAAKSKDGPAHRTAQVDSSEILATFDTLIQVLRDKRDPYSEEVLSSIRNKIRSLVQFELARIAPDTPLDATYNRLEGDGDPGFGNPAPVSCTQFRFVNSQLPRVFQLYSRTIGDLVLPKNQGAILSATTRQHHSVLAQDLLKSFLAKGEASSLEQIDSALACSATLAALGKFSAASAIASSVLHLVTSQIRATEEKDFTLKAPNGTSAIVMALAFKELFLLRYYCECVVALQDLDVLLRSSKGLARPEGGAIKNFARAQRDLNFAIYVNEKAALLAGGQLAPGWCHIPGGLPYFEDFRLPIVRFDGWLQQFIMLWQFGYMDEPDPLLGAWHRQLWGQRRRAILWAADGFIKEVEAVAFRAGSIAERYRADSVSKSPKYGNIRYFSYVEARALQHLNIALTVFVAFDISREIQGLWNPEVNATHDHLLFFRNWRFWRARFEALDREYDFKFRTDKFVAPILTAVIEIDEIRKDIQTSRRIKDSSRGARAARKNIEWKDRYGLILADLREEMHKLNEFSGAIEDKLFLRYVREAVVRKTNVLMTRLNSGVTRS